MRHKTNSLGSTFKDVLGGLSIIIFLSSPSIAGYTTASAKNRANQILNGASVRAIVISTQIQRGFAAPTLSEFTDNEVGGAKFGTKVQNTAGTADWNKDTDKRFSLTLENVPAEVCAQMKAMIGENGIIRKIDDGCTTITYNNDLSLNDPAPSGPKGDECTDSCSGGATCVNGYCQCAEGIWQPSDNSGNGECETGLTGDCTTNADCKEKGKYCEIIGTWENSCSVPTTGTCTALNNGYSTIYKEKTFLYSSDHMISWWAARNWCLAHGKSLASPLSDLSCTTGGCDDWDALTKAFGYSYYWTSYSYDSCTVFSVSTDHQLAGRSSSSNDNYALCR